MPLAGREVQLTEDQVALIDTVRDFARAELLPLDRKCDKDESSMVEALPQVSRMGLMNLTIPEELGGLGCEYRTYVAILHELAYASPSMAVTISVHSMVGAILAKLAEEPFRSEWLSAWGTPESFAAFALSEANAGSDAAAVAATAVKADGGYRITGEKMWITNGMKARWFLTLARLDGAPQGEDLCAFLVDGNENSAAIQRTHVHGKMGIRGSETAVIAYDDAFAPESHMIGKPGEGLKVFLSTLNEGRIGIGTQASGIAEACLDEMAAYAKQRVQFGRPIAKFQAVANMIAESALMLEAAKALIWCAAEKLDAGRPDRVASSMAKLYATEAANRIAYHAVQVHGGSGYVNEYRVEQLYRDARVTTIYEGTSEVQRILIARELAQHL
ncbi:MAG: acyl-CoA dehydrogenase family protein [Phycisphaerales bacterium]|nr:MAG: acyl-CoA dehydrogenase family protein [Phycisphaerales bacterium]